MKRSLIIIIIILISISCGWFFQNRILTNLFNSADLSLTKISSHIRSEDYSSAHSEFNLYNKWWNNKEKILCTLISHEDIDFITRCNGQLRAYIKTPGKEEALGVISELYETYRELEGRFKVNIKTIF